LSVKYLLPCRCGQEIAVEPRQAGEMMSCRCGASLPVPTLLEMTRLEVAPEATTAPSSQASWSWRHGLLLLGTVFLLLAIAAAIAVYRERPRAPADLLNPDAIRVAAGKFSPPATFYWWEQFKKSGLGATDTAYAAQLAVYHGLWTIPGILALLGLGAIVAVISSRETNAKRQRGNRQSFRT
jgi:hypothetical protein